MTTVLAIGAIFLVFAALLYGAGMLFVHFFVHDPDDPAHHADLDSKGERPNVWSRLRRR